MRLFEYKISSDFPVINKKKCIVINTINPHSYVTAKNDHNFRSALLNSDFLFPDGVGIVMALYLNGFEVKKVAGYDIFIHYMNVLNSNKKTCFFLGSSNETLNKIRAKISKDFPNIVFKCYSPPFKNIFSKSDNNKILKKINQSKADVLFVGMTAPKQEKWVDKHKSYLKVNLICSVGAVFDFYAGTVTRPSKFWVSLGLEWFVRLLREPLRLYRRTVFSGPQFIFDVLSYKIFGRIFL